MNQDAELLQEYARTGSPQAFAGLVERLAGLVYTAAYRQLGERHLAEDVSQLAFLAMAKKARSLSTETVPAAWLLVATRHLVRDARKAAARRAVHERRVAEMAISKSPATSRESWHEIEPLLDVALCSLSADDRRAVTLRYFQGREVDEVAEALGVSPAAARQRVYRAILKLRDYFLSRGVAVPAAQALGTLIIAHATVPPPQTVVPGIVQAFNARHVATLAKGALLKGIIPSVTSKVVIGTSAVVLALAAVAYHARRSSDKVIVIGSPGAARLILAQRPSRNRLADGWQVTFEGTYGLGQGELLKRVAPPFIPERRSFCLSQEIWGEKDLSAAVLQLSWNGEARLTNAWFGNALSLGNLVRASTHLRTFDFEGMGPIEKLPLPGDWVIRSGSRPDELLRAITDILRSEFGRTIQFVSRTVERDVIVVSGKLQMPSAAEWPTPGFLYIGFDRPRPGAFVGGNLDDFVGDAGELAGMKIVNEAAPITLPLRWYRDVSSGKLGDNSAQRQKLLSRLSSQTNLTFRIDRRPVSIWFVEEHDHSGVMSP